MNRTVFGKGSGIVVDVCRPHGTWFDADELSRALLFVAKGGETATIAKAKGEPKPAVSRVVAEAEVALMQESFRDNQRAAQDAGIVAGFVDILFNLLIHL